MAKRLTDIGIRNLKPGPVRREISDAGSGLYLVQQPSGHQSWAVRYRAAGRPIKLTLGSWPRLSLHDARVAAAEALKAVKQGNDPARARQDAKVKAMEAQANTVASVCAAYLKREGGKLRTSTSSQRESIFRRLVYPAIGERPIDSIKRSEIVRLLDQIEDKSGPRMADVTLAVLRRVFTWHALRDDDFASPIVRGMNRQNAKDHRRARILTDDELRAVWAATADNAPFSALVRFLLLTSARRTEAAGMRWDEVVDGIWSLPAARSKTKVEVVRPLSKAAQEVLAGLPRFEGCAVAFTSTILAPLRQFSSPKARLDTASGVTGWRLHDLRRTARSLLSRAGVNSDIGERCLGHSLGDIRERYDRHKYLDEMAHAFEALSAEIETIIHPPEGAVIPLRRR
jgi:integrase